MQTMQLMDQAVELADRFGLTIRHEWLGGSGGGLCEFAGRKWIFVDLALTTHEQLEQIVDALRELPDLESNVNDDDLGRLLTERKAA